MKINIHLVKSKSTKWVYAFDMRREKYIGVVFFGRRLVCCIKPYEESKIEGFFKAVKFRTFKFFHITCNAINI